MYSGGGLVLGATTVAGGGELLSKTGSYPIVTIVICGAVAILALCLAHKSKSATSNQ